MKIIIILAVIVFTAATPEYCEYEYLDMDKLIANKNEFIEFTECLLEKIPCNKVFESYRVRTAEAVRSRCKKCSPHVKHMFWQYLQAVKILPDLYVELKAFYDPHSLYFNALLAELKIYEHEHPENLHHNQ